MAAGAHLTFHKVTEDNMPPAMVADGIYFVRTATGMRVVVTSENGEAVNLEVPGSAAFVQTFTAAAQWVVNHNLGRKPAAIAVLSPGGVEVDANIVHTSDNQFVVDLSPPMAGQVVVQ